MREDWMPWGMKRRDLLLRRYWRREDDGTYVILYHSVLHGNYRPEKGYIRASLKSGGFVISPTNQGKQSVVKHMLAIDWKLWKSYLFSSSTKYVTTRMLTRVSALRELFRTKLGSRTFSDISVELKRESWFAQSEEEDIKVEVQSDSDNSRNNLVQISRRSSAKSENMDEAFLQRMSTGDEFFDLPDESEFNQPDHTWPCDDGFHSQEDGHPRISTTSLLKKRLHDLKAQKNDYIDLKETSVWNVLPYSYGATLPKDPRGDMPCSWKIPDPSIFLIRGESYLKDNHKIKADRTLMQIVAADWLTSDKREDDLGCRPGGIVQKYAIECSKKFFFIVNLQIPGSTTYSLALYFMMDTPLEEVPLLESFIKGDDAYRNSKFKIIPCISKGSWIVKQSVGKKACLIGQALRINYCRGKNYFELDIDIGSSAVAKGIVNLVISYVTNLVIDMAFLIEGSTQVELPEVLLGACQLNHLDLTKAVPANP